MTVLLFPEYATWFKDYLYISLGGNRVSVPRCYLNLMIVFIISGFWHGANCTYIIWGILNGLYLVFAIQTNNFRNKLSKKIGISRLPKLNIALKILSTFVITCFAWIFFRASNLSDAFVIIKGISSFNGPIYFENNISSVIYPLLGIIFLIIVETKWEFYHGNFFFS